MAPFYESGSTALRLEPPTVSSLLFINKFPEVPGTHLSNSEGSTAKSTLEPSSGFEHRAPG